MSTAPSAQGVIEVERATAATREIADLIGELDRELAGYYPPEQQHGLALKAIFRSDVLFFLARANGSAVGCGGIALSDTFAEVKRMYVRPEWRGRGVADAVLERLIAETVKVGIGLLRLETGEELLAATTFYRRHGFRTCGAFEPYTFMSPDAVAASLFLEKSLSMP